MQTKIVSTPKLSSRAVQQKRAVAVAAAKKEDYVARNLASLMMTGMVMSPSAAFAADDTIDSVVKALTSGIEVAGSAAKTASPYVQDVIKQATPIVQDTVNQATPVVQEGLKVGSKVISDAATAAKPLVSEASKQLGDAITASGVSIPASNPAVKSVIAAVGGFVSAVADYISKEDPTILAEEAVALVLAYYILPPVFGVLGDVLKGYKGDLTAPQSLDLLLSDSSAVLVDIRSVREKEAGGLPDLPGSASSRYVEVEFAQVDKRIRGLLKDATHTEAELTALQIGNLRRLTNKTPVVILDATGFLSKTIAKSLGRKGFSQVYVVANGFKGWQQSKLETKVARTVFNPTVVVDSTRPSVFADRNIGKSVSGGKPLGGSKSIKAGNARALPAPRD